MELTENAKCFNSLFRVFSFFPWLDSSSFRVARRGHGSQEVLDEWLNRLVALPRFLQTARRVAAGQPIGVFSGRRLGLRDPTGADRSGPGAGRISTTTEE